MSTDRRRPRIPVRYAALLVLACLAGALAAANLVHGPRLSGIEANSELLVSRDAQRVVVRFNQPVERVDPADVSVEPAAPHTVTTDGATVTVQFDGMLDYGTDYSVTVDATSAATGTQGRVAARFGTPEPEVRSIVPGVGSGGADRVVRHRIGAPGSERAGQEVAEIEAPAIREYAMLESGGAVISVPEGRYPELLIADDADADPVPVLNLERLEMLRSDPSSGLVGVVGTGVDANGFPHDRTLFLIDTREETVTAVQGALGNLISVEDWRFIPGTTSVVLRNGIGGLMIFETWPEPKLLDVGVSGRIEGFVPGSAVLAVGADGAGADGADAEGAGADGPDADGSVADHAGSSDDAARIRLLDFSGAVIGALDASVPEVEASEVPEFERFEAAAGFAADGARVCLSPNAEMVSVEDPADTGDAAGSDSGVRSGAADEGDASAGATMRILRLDGSEVQELRGIRSGWCR